MSDDRPLPLSAHLAELRRRLVVSLAAILVGAAALLPLAPTLFRLITAPLARLLQPGQSFVAFTPFESWIVLFQIACVGGVILAAPIWAAQLFAFAAPALPHSVRRRAIAGGIVTGLLFVGGAAFCFAFIIPRAAAWGVELMAASGVSYLPRMSESVAIVLRLTLAFGIAFELPVALALAIRLGLVTSVRVTRARPYAVVGAFVLAALLTPPDVFTQIALALPLILLFELGLLVGRVWRKDCHSRVV